MVQFLKSIFLSNTIIQVKEVKKLNQKDFYLKYKKE